MRKDTNYLWWNVEARYLISWSKDCLFSSFYLTVYSKSCHLGWVLSLSPRSLLEMQTLRPWPTSEPGSSFQYYPPVIQIYFKVWEALLSLVQKDNKYCLKVVYHVEYNSWDGKINLFIIYRWYDCLHRIPKKIRWKIIKNTTKLWQVSGYVNN